MEFISEKYYPKSIDDFNVKDNFSNIVKSFIKLENLNIIIVGGMSTGKTSLIQLIIQNYYKDFNNYDDNILYINSLYDQGISQLRQDIRTFCQTYSNIPGKKKFIILDDIDYIPIQNQQILRNFIDKYTNVFFIMSCSNINKVIESLQSKQYMIKINNFNYDSLYNISKNILEKEQIIITEDALEFIIRISNNSIRVILNYFDKIKILNDNNKINNLEYIKSICTNIKHSHFDEYFELLKNNNIKDAINILNNYYHNGFSVIDILDVMFEYIKITKNIEQNIKYNIIETIINSIITFNELHEDEIELSFFTYNLYQIIKKI